MKTRTAIESYGTRRTLKITSTRNKKHNKHTDHNTDNMNANPIENEDKKENKINE